MHHTSGVPDYLKLLDSQGHPESKLTTRQQALATLRTAKLSFRPGSDWEYSNSNYLLLEANVPYEQVGDAGIQTTPGELVRWADNYRTGKVGGAVLTHAVLKGAADSRIGDGVRYGAGIAQLPDGSLWHNGVLGGFLTDLWISRDRRDSVASPATATGWTLLACA